MPWCVLEYIRNPLVHGEFHACTTDKQCAKFSGRSSDFRIILQLRLPGQTSGQ